MICVRKDLKLHVCLRNSIFLYQPILSDGLDCILSDVLHILKLSQIDPSKGTLTNNISDQKVGQRSVWQAICLAIHLSLVLASKSCIRLMFNIFRKPFLSSILYLSCIGNICLQIFRKESFRIFNVIFFNFFIFFSLISLQFIYNIQQRIALFLPL